jgi:hypothetical protein
VTKQITAVDVLSSTSTSELTARHGDLSAVIWTPTLPAATV